MALNDRFISKTDRDRDKQYLRVAADFPYILEEHQFTECALIFPGGKTIFYHCPSLQQTVVVDIWFKQ